MRGAWHVSEVKDLQELKGKFTEIVTPDKAPFVKAVSGMVNGRSASGSASRRRSPSFSTRRRTSESAIEVRLHKGGGHPPPFVSKGGMP